MTWALEPHQVALLFEASGRTREKERDRAILCLCLDAGLRRREIPSLKVRAVDIRRGTISIMSGQRRRIIRFGQATSVALAPFIAGRTPSATLLTDRRGRPVTDRVVHEQLRRIGELAGLGEWVTNRHTRRTFVRMIATCHAAPVALHIAGHAGHRIRQASPGAALAAQFAGQWMSPLDLILVNGRVRAAS